MALSKELLTCVVLWVSNKKVRRRELKASQPMGRGCLEARWLPCVGWDVGPLLVHQCNSSRKIPCNSSQTLHCIWVVEARLAL